MDLFNYIVGIALEKYKKSLKTSYLWEDPLNQQIQTSTVPILETPLEMFS